MGLLPEANASQGIPESFNDVDLASYKMQQANTKTEGAAATSRLSQPRNCQHLF